MILVLCVCLNHNQVFYLIILKSKRGVRYNLEHLNVNVMY